MSGPTFSIVTPVFDPPVDIWRDCARSVMDQVDLDWEWIVVDDGSRDPELLAALAELTVDEPRVRVIHRCESGGIVAATNDGIDLATGRYLAFLDHDDALHPDALAQVRALLDGGEVDLIYSDEVIVAADGTVVDAVHKPGWSPERLRAQNYVNHLAILRAELVRSLGGLRPGFDGSQDHDLLLRVVEKARAIAHAPQPLYRWRMAPDSVLTQGVRGKPEAWEAGQRAVTEHLRRVGIAADVGRLEVPGVGTWYRVRRRLDPAPSVALVVSVTGEVAAAWRDGMGVGTGAGHGVTAVAVDPVRAVCSAVKLAGHDPLEVVLAVAPDVPTELADDLEHAVTQGLSGLGAGAPTVVRGGHEGLDPTTPGALANAGAVHCHAAHLVFLDPTAEPQTDGWVAELVGLTAEAGVGAAGGRLLATGGVLEQAGYALVHGAPSHLMRGLPVTTTAYGGTGLVPGERSAVSGAFLAVSRAAFTQVGGFSTIYAAAFHDVDLCLKLRQSNYRVIYSPHADALLPAGRLPAASDPALGADLERLRIRWSPQLSDDPYVNPAVRDADWLGEGG